MHETDTLFRGYLDTMPPAPPGTAERAAANALGQPPQRHEPARSRTRGRFAAAAATATMVGAIGVLFVTTRSEPQAPTAAGDARVDWGIVGTVRVTPLPGVSNDEAIQRLRVAITERAAERDIAGLQIERPSPTTLRLTLPGGEEFNHVRNLAAVSRFAVYDLSDTQVAAGPTNGSIVAAATSLRGRPTQFLIALAGERGGWTAFPSRERAERAIRQRRWSSAGVTLALPAGYGVVGGQATVRLVRDRPAFDARSIERIAFRARTVQITPRSRDRRRAANVALSAKSKATEWLVTTDNRSLGPQEVATADTIRWNGTALVLSGVSPAGLERIWPGQPVVPAEVKTQSATPFGTLDPPQGDRDRLPSALSGPEVKWFSSHTGTSFDVDPATIVRTVSATFGENTFAGYAGLTTSGRNATWFERRNLPAGREDQIIPIECGPGPGVPTVRYCTMEVNRRTAIIVGRARADVSRVTLLAPSGKATEAVLGNGWFIAETPVDQPGRVATPTHVARDASGAIVARTRFPFETIERPGP